VDNLDRRTKTATNQAVHSRNYRRARDRALAKLSHLYPDTYKQLLGIEKAIDEQEGKNWIDLSGSSRMATRTSTPDGELTTTGETGSQARDNGGEA
jgi:hypothetical protein